MTAPGPVVAYIGLGSNLDDPASRVRTAMAALERLSIPGSVRCSSLYRSAPVGVGPQPDYVNAACRIETRLAPAELVSSLLGIEREHGRVRGPQKGSARTLDLDLLLYGDRRVNEPAVTVPHPRMHERAFVLAPLAELDAGLVIPGRGRVTALLGACAGQRCVRLES
jgi:2-amino-4-hydroxy-6-hydroxymethyldihydropteridine diphosphokinase